MRHGMDHRKLRRNPSHRKALMRNLMNALVRSERIVTTVAKAKELRRLADRLVTLGKRNDTHARRIAFAMLSDKENTDKIFAGLAARFLNRHGGYTRIVRTGYRAGDGSDMAILEYLPSEEKKAGAAKGRKKGAAKPGAGGKGAAKKAGQAPAARKKTAGPARKASDKERTAKEKSAGKKTSAKSSGKDTREDAASQDKRGGVKKTSRKRTVSKPD